MRGNDEVQEGLFSFSRLEDFVPANHPLRWVRALVNQALSGLDELFNRIYADSGRASIAPEKLLRAMLIQILFSVRSERQLMEQVRYNLLFRWFIGLAIDDEAWDHSVFAKNRDRLLANEVVERFFTEVMTRADKQGLLSKEHFSVDGTLIQAWASHKSFVPRDGGDDDGGGGAGRNAQANWKGKPRGNDTHVSTTDASARLYRKSHNTAAVLSYQGHVLMENRSGLVVGADKAYDTADFVAACRQRRVTPHVAANDSRPGGSAIDARTLRHAGYKISQVIRKRIEEHFGWGKLIGPIRQTLYRGIRAVDQQFKLTMTASNLVRMARILHGSSPAAPA